MNIPKKIQIVNSARSVNPRMRFDNWEGYDAVKIDEHLAYKINEIIDFLYNLPEVPNFTPPKVKSEDGVIVHDHDWLLTGHLGNKGFYECRECKEQQIRLMGR